MSVKIAITGHRALEDAGQVKQQIQNEIQSILETTKATHFYAFTSLAAGSDCLFADVAAQLGGMIKVVLPFPEDEYLKDFDCEETSTFRQLIALDKTPVFITHDIPATSENRDEAYYAAGKYVADHCDYLIAVWDGEKSNGRGGTADIVDYARKAGKKVIHIKACRSDISRLYLYYDKKAIARKKLYEWLWNLSIFSSLSAALILAAYISFDLSEYNVELAIVEFMAVVLSLSIIFLLRWSKLNTNRILYRRAAERLRVMERFDKSCIHNKQLTYTLDLADITALEKKYQDISHTQTDFEKSRKGLLGLVEEQIDYHTKNRPEIKGKLFHRLEKLQFPLLIFFLAGVFFHFLSVLLREGDVSHLMHEAGLMLSLSIPPLYAAIEGYIYFKEYHKIMMDSNKMKDFFTDIKEEIHKIDNSAENDFEILSSYAFQIRKSMDAETKDWSDLFGHIKSPGI